MKLFNLAVWPEEPPQIQSFQCWILKKLLTQHFLKISIQIGPKRGENQQCWTRLGGNETQ